MHSEGIWYKPQSGEIGMSYGEKTRPGRCPEQQLIAQRPLMINQAREVFCQGRLPASLIYVVVSPSPAVPSTFMPVLRQNSSRLWNQ